MNTTVGEEKLIEGASQFARSSSSWRRFVPRFSEYGVVYAFVILAVVLSVANPAFLTASNLGNILDQWAYIGIIACAGTFVIIAGGFDLSVGGIFVMSAIIAAKVAAVSTPLGITVGIVAGLVLGIINGILVVRLRMNAFIATLASSIVFRGAAVALTGGLLVTVADPAFRTLGNGGWLSTKFTVWIFAAVVVVLSFLMSKTVYGSYVKAVGGNEEAARLSGVRVDLVRLSTFALSGLCAGLAGVIVASRSGTGQAAAGVGLELTVIAAIVLGGTSVRGGEGAIWRTVFGVLVLALIGNGFNMMNADPTYQQVFQGLIILGAIALNGWTGRRT